MSFLAHAAVVMALAGVIVLAGFAFTYVVVRRSVRRRWRRVGGPAAARGALAAWSLVSEWRERSGGRSSPEAQSQGSATRARRQMWVAIDDAERAVQHADATNAPVADLPSVCRSLRKVGKELDALLCLERRLPQSAGRPEVVRAQVAEVIRSARQVQVAALQATADATESQCNAVVRDVRDEVEIVSAVLARLRPSASPRS